MEILESKSTIIEIKSSVEGSNTRFELVKERTGKILVEFSKIQKTDQIEIMHAEKRKNNEGK